MTKVLSYQIVILFSYGISGFIWVPFADAGNTCVECHRSSETIQTLPAWYQDSFVHWYGSVHGREGVTCDKCHGGDPGSLDQDKAHEHILPSNDPKSPVNFKNVPETCGTCHKEVYQQYSTSKHFKNLKEGNLAPNCTTCHGFQMDIQQLKPLKIAERCRLCHNKRTGIKPGVADLAREVLSGIDISEDAIRKAQVAIELVKEQGVDPKKAEKLLKETEKRFSKTAKLWHQFRLDFFEEELKKVQTSAREATREAMGALQKNKK